MSDDVFVLHPISFDVIDFLKALSAQNDYCFAVFNPTNNRPFGDQLVSVTEIGISFLKPIAKRKMGFPTTSIDENDLVYVLEANLSLVPIPAGTIAGIDIDAWTLLVEDADEAKKYFWIAKALQDRFGVRVVLSSRTKDDKNEHLDPVLVNEMYPQGPLVCEVLPRRDLNLE